MQARFDRFDTDGSGALNTGEVQGLLRSMGFDVDSGYVQGVLATFDTDSTHGLEISEFEKLFVFLSESQQATVAASPVRSPSSITLNSWVWVLRGWCSQCLVSCKAYELLSVFIKAENQRFKVSDYPFLDWLTPCSSRGRSRRPSHP